MLQNRMFALGVFIQTMLLGAKERAKGFENDQEGSGLFEYALLIAFIAIIAIVAITAFGGAISQKFNQWAGSL